MDYGMEESRKAALSRIVMMVSVLAFLLSAMQMLRGREPFHTWFYCFAWWSYILFLESFLHRRGGRSLLFNAPGSFFLQLPLSVTIWLIFEIFNFYLKNWHYLEVPSALSVRWLGYALSFSTVIPGIFSTARLLDHLGLFKHLQTALPVYPDRLHLPFLATGIVFLVLPLMWPRYFFSLVWGGFIFLLEPLNHRLGGDSILREWAQGSIRRFFILLSAGAICGFLWELWNFWAGAKWVYTVPFVGWLKIFEMPLLGFLGFPPFAVECYAMYSAFLLLGKRIRESSASPQFRRVIWVVASIVLVLFDLLVFLGIDRHTVASFAG